MTTAGVLVWGEALVDLVPQERDATGYRAVLGGSGWNTALALARQGASVALAASLSTDALGRRFVAAADQEGIDLSHAALVDAPTPLAVVEPLDDGGQASYRFHLDGSAFDHPPEPPNELASFDHLHLTSFAALRGESGRKASTLLDRAKGAGLSTSFDVNIRPPALPPPDRTRAEIAKLAASCDLLRLSDEDARWLDGAGWRDRLPAWFAAGPALLLLTEGADGASLIAHDRAAITVRPAPVAVVDTIGAGDVFVGAFLAALARAHRLGGALRTLDDTTARAALEHAAEAAAANCAATGCDPPRFRR